MKLWITFGQDHTHRVNGVTWDRNIVAEIDCFDYAEGRQIAEDLFGTKFAFSYTPQELQANIHLFPRGVVNIDPLRRFDGMTASEVKEYQDAVGDYPKNDPDPSFPIPWERFRRDYPEDGNNGHSIDLVAAYRYARQGKIRPSDEQFLSTVELLQPIKSRQVAALALALTGTIAWEGDISEQISDQIKNTLLQMDADHVLGLNIGHDEETE